VFPRAFRRIAGSLGLATALFACAAAIGLSMAVVQPGMGAVFLGPDAMAGLREGRMWTDALTSTVPPALSSSKIATNNMGVAILAWGGGALAGLGALWVVIMNGLLLGVVIGTTLPYGMTGRLLEFVAAHGPLEITLILVSAGAGLEMGRALLQAGDRPRAEAMRAASLQALVVLGGCLPWFALLAVVEAFVSPAADVLPSTKIALGAVLWASFALLAWNPFLGGE
jgi:uncharacterized membrane protein SpoIIM required for sporulation